MLPRNMEWLFLRTASLSLIIVLATAPFAFAQWQDSFETPEASWWLYSKSAGQKLHLAKRVFQDARDGVGYEKLELTQREKSRIQIAQRIDPMLVIDDLQIQLWVKSSRVGAQIGARISLPRTVSAKTGERTSVVVLGDKVSEANRWVLLQVKDLATLLDAELPKLRRASSKRIDAAEAYVDLVIVEENAGPGEIQICVDGLSIDGIVFAKDNATKTRNARHETLSGAAISAQSNATASAITQINHHQVKVDAGIFEIDGRPEFVRSIEYSGESFEYLKSLGFNAVELRQPPTPQQDQEAWRLGLWLISPPAFDPKVVQKQRAFASVIAWSLGEGVSEAELESARRYIAETRSRSSEESLPFIASADSHLWEWSRLVDLLVTDAHGVMGNSPLSDSGQHIQAERAKGRPGAPSWAVIHTEPAATLAAQWNSLSSEWRGSVSLTPEQIRLQAIHGVLGGVRGLVFKSRTRLDGKDAASELRAATLKWVNLQLDLFAPWAATGDASIISDAKSETLVGALTSDRATLFILANQSADAQYETSGAFRSTTTTILSGHFERSPRYQLTWRGVRQISPSKSRDSSRVVIERTGSVDCFLLAEDPAALKYTAELVQQKCEEFSAAQVLVASLWMAQSQSAMQLPHNEFAVIETKLTQAGQEAAKNDHFKAIRSSDEAMRQIAAIRHRVWNRMIGAMPSPLQSPFCVNAELVVPHQELVQRLQQAQWTSKHLPGGDLESIEAIQNASWLAYEANNPELDVQITSCDRSPHAGRGAISLLARSPKSDEFVSTVSAAITSAGVPVQRGELIRYRVWLRSGDQVASPSPKVQLFDSLGGRILAVEVPVTSEWTPCVFYRLAPADGEATLTIALLGAGNIDIDSVELESVTQEQLSSSTATSK